MVIVRALASVPPPNPLYDVFSNDRERLGHEKGRSSSVLPRYIEDFEFMVKAAYRE